MVVALCSCFACEEGERVCCMEGSRGALLEHLGNSVDRGNNEGGET